MGIINSISNIRHESNILNTAAVNEYKGGNNHDSSTGT